MNRQSESQCFEFPKAQAYRSKIRKSKHTNLKKLYIIFKYLSFVL
jgi:hypothetical protein